jgi:quercetin dioxygenase-like cupin family protein
MSRSAATLPGIPPVEGVALANNPFHLPAGSGPSYSFEADGKHLFRFLAMATQTGGSYSAMEIVSPQRSGPGPHSHPGSEEYFLLLDGRVVFIVAGEQYDVEPGDFLHVPRGAVHEFKVVTPSSRMIAMYSPGGPEATFAAHGTLVQPPGDGHVGQA